MQTHFGLMQKRTVVGIGVNTYRSSSSLVFSRFLRYSCRETSLQGRQHLSRHAAVSVSPWHHAIAAHEKSAGLGPALAWEAFEAALPRRRICVSRLPLVNQTTGQQRDDGTDHRSHPPNGG